METSTEGVDWHRDGADPPWWLLPAFLLVAGGSVALTAFLVLWVL